MASPYVDANRVMPVLPPGTANGHGVAALHLPHGIALSEPLDALCLADREGRRVACYRAGLRDGRRFGALVASVPEVHGRRVFDVAALG